MCDQSKISHMCKRSGSSSSTLPFGWWMMMSKEMMTIMQAREADVEKLCEDNHNTIKRKRWYSWTSWREEWIVKKTKREISGIENCPSWLVKSTLRANLQTFVFLNIHEKEVGLTDEKQYSHTSTQNSREKKNRLKNRLLLTLLFLCIVFPYRFNLSIFFLS